MKNNKPESYTSFLFDVLKRYDHYIAGTGPKRKLGAWHRFKIRNNRPAQQSIAYLFKITQCLEVFSTLLPAVALEQYSSEKAKQALVGINEKFANRNYT